MLLFDLFKYTQTSEIRDILKKEVRKGEQADIEEVINLVTRLTSLDTINGRNTWIKLELNGLLLTIYLSHIVSTK